MSAFKRDTEAEAYRVLHTDGMEALEAAYGTGIAIDLINTWADRKLIRAKWDADSRLKITTFKKYAA